jgi:hypothetical protein
MIDKETEMTRSQTILNIHSDRWALVILTAHVLTMILLWSPASTGPDTNGYYVQTRLLGDEGRLWTEYEIPFQYISQHWLVVNDDTLVSRYPPGIAILQVVPYWLFGSGFTLLNPILTSGTLLGVYLLARRWVGGQWALIAMGIAALNPVMNSWAFEGDSHPAVVFFLIWGIFAIISWSQKQGWFSLIPIALWMGMIPTFRYPEALYIPAFSLFIWAHQDWSRRGFLQGTLLGIVGLIPLLMVYLYNQSFFGDFGETGYGTGEKLFSFWYFIQKMIPYPLMIIGYGVTGFSILGMAGLVWLCKHKENRSIGILFCGIIIPITLLYMAYFFFDGPMRFLMPTFPLYIIAGVWYLKYLHTTYPERMHVWTPRIVALTLAVGMIESGFTVTVKVSEQATIYRSAQQIAQFVPKDNVLIAPENIQNQLDFLGGWKLVNESIIQGRDDHRPGMPPINERHPNEDPNRPHRGPQPRQDPFMDELTQSNHYRTIREYYQSDQPGTLSQHAIDDLKKWSEKERAFYWLGELDTLKQTLPEEFSIELITELKAPQGRHHGPPGNHRPPGPPRRGPQNRNDEPVDKTLALVMVSW